MDAAPTHPPVALLALLEMQDGPRDILEPQRASLSAHCAAAVETAVATIPGASPRSAHLPSPFTTNEDSLPGRPLYECFARARAQEMQATELLICFHGTASRNIRPISREGLDASKRGSAHGQVFGTGEYFAESLPLALQYAIRHRQLEGVNQVLVFAVLARQNEIRDKRGSCGRIFVIADPARTLPLGVLTVPQHAEKIVLEWSRAWSRERQGETPQQQVEREQLEHTILKKVDRMFKHLGEDSTVKVPPLAVDQLGFCTSSRCTWQLRAARHCLPGCGHWLPTATATPPRVLERAASTKPPILCLWPSRSKGPRRGLGHMAVAARGARRRPAGLRRTGGLAARHCAYSCLMRLCPDPNSI